MSIKCGGVSIRLGVFAAAFAACLLNSGLWKSYLAGAAAVMLHEAVHLCLMRRYGCGGVSVRILPGGVSITAPGFESMEDRQAALCLIGAPLSNLFCFAVLSAFYVRFRRGPLLTCAAVNLALGAVNLLPMSFLDGGRTFAILYRRRKTERQVRSACLKADVFCLAVMVLAIAVLAAGRFFSVHFFVFFCYCAVMTAANHKKNVDFC